MAFNVTVRGFGSFTATVNGEQAVLAAEVHDASALMATMAAQGAKGDKGDTGATGGVGPTGPKGEKGDTGSAATIAVGTTSTLPAGSSATVANVGTSGAAVFDFGIPQGEKGDKGNTGDTGPQGPSGVVSATSPLAYDSGTKNLSIDLSAYLTITSAAATYQTQAAMSAYLTTSAASSTYETQTHAAATYQPISGMSAYYLASNPSGYITSSALSPYLLSSTAASTYQTISGMSSYAAKSSSNNFTANQVIEVTDNTNAALRVTQLGTGESFRVEDSTSPDATPFVISNAGEVGIGGNYSTGSSLRVVGTSQFIGGAGVSISIASGSNVPLTITNSGTGNSFVVNDQASDPSPFVIDASGNVSVGGTLDVTTAPAANDNSTKVPTTAWVQTYVPAASTSTAGKVQLATDAEALTKTSTTKAVTPSNLVGLQLGVGRIGFVISAFGTATSGTGGTNDTLILSRRLSGPTSTGAGYVAASHGWVPGRGQTTSLNIDWTKRIRVYARLVRNAPSPSNDSIYRFTFGESTSNTGDPTVRSIGIKVIGAGTITLLAHDGTTLSTVSSSFTPINGQAIDLLLVSDGAGAVDCYVNDTLIATTTGGPKTLLAGTGGQNALYTKIENLSTFTANPTSYLCWVPCAEYLP